MCSCLKLKGRDGLYTVFISSNCYCVKAKKYFISLIWFLFRGTRAAHVGHNDKESTAVPDVCGNRQPRTWDMSTSVAVCLPRNDRDLIQSSVFLFLEELFNQLLTTDLVQTLRQYIFSNPRRIMLLAKMV